MATATSLYLCRHAEVEESYHRVFGGRLDIGLSPKGQTQAQALAAWLSRFTFDAIYCSPMQRVQLTLDPFRKSHAGPITAIPGLREVDFGDWTGHSWEEVEAKFGHSAFDWLGLMEDNRITGAEQVEHFRSRVAESLRQILHTSAGQKVAVFAHGGVIRMALAVLLDLPLSKFEHIEVSYASVTHVEVGAVKAGRPRTEVQLLNFTPWRDL
ncbi:MAG TPA: histidine phosphatase family protein [Candidatus Limnocylindria bacterium]|jgi:broad specificity phosphatase PhoE|nr:histidine phosphatase family protein [Candidatus Limnocylindria bacterium]